jgi:hypothetical protein
MAGWAMPDYNRVADARYFKIQIPPKIFLTRFFVSLYALFAKFVDKPTCHIVCEAAWIDEILFWFGHVESPAPESDDCSNFGVHDNGDSNPSHDPGASIRCSPQTGSPLVRRTYLTRVCFAAILVLAMTTMFAAFY